MLRTDFLRSSVRARYAIAPIVDVRLLRRGRLEAYRITTHRDWFALRVHPCGTEPERLEWALSMLARASPQRLVVGAPIRGVDGCYAQALDTGIGFRQVSLHCFEEVAPFRIETAFIHQLGRCIGGFHRLGELGGSPATPPRYDALECLDRSLSTLTARYSASPEICALIRRHGAAIRVRLENIEYASRLMLCHGNLGRENVVLVPNDRVALLGSTGCALGHPAADLAELRTILHSDGNWRELIAAYSAVVPLEAEDVAAIGPFSQLRELASAATLDREAARWGRTWEGYDRVDAIVATLLSSRYAELS